MGGLKTTLWLPKNNRPDKKAVKAARDSFLRAGLHNILALSGLTTDQTPEEAG